MASVWKRKADRKDSTKPWRITFRGPGGRPKTVKGLLDKRESERLGAKLEEDADQRRRGLVDEHAAAMALQEARPITEHLAEFVAYLKSKGTSEQTIDAAEVRIRRIIAEAKAGRIADLTPSVVMGGLERLRTPGTNTAKGLSLKTASHYIGAIKSFTRWLVRDKRTRADTLAHLQTFNDATDRRRVRRDLEADEVARLIDAAERSPWIIFARRERDEKKNLRTVPVRMHYPDRAWAYRIAASTGFRAAEIASLTPESFKLDGPTPTVRCAAGYTKNKREAEQPIRPDFAAMLKEWLKSRKAGKPVCRMPKGKAAALLRADMDAARAIWLAEAKTAAERKRWEGSDFLLHIDSAGRVADFHGLRVHYISRVVEAGASMKEAMELARHADPKLTLKTYSRVRLSALSGVLDGLPSMAPAGPDHSRTKATGTDGGVDPTVARSAGAAPVAASSGIVSQGPAVAGRIGGGGTSGANPGASRGCGTPRPRVARGGRNAEGGTRTPDLRVMNPAL